MTFTCPGSKASIYGVKKQILNIFGIPQGALSTSASPPGVMDDKVFLDILEKIQELVLSFESLVNRSFADDGFNILPETTLNNVSVNASLPPLLARRIYYASGYKNLPNGKVDCQILEEIYRYHPLMKPYSFMMFEPGCA